MRLRSLLFVPGDRPERFSKAVASGADALILDLEDSVVPAAKGAARAAVANYLRSSPARGGGARAARAGGVISLARGRAPTPPRVGRRAPPPPRGAGF